MMVSFNPSEMTVGQTFVTFRIMSSHPNFLRFLSGDRRLRLDGSIHDFVLYSRTSFHYRSLHFLATPFKIAFDFSLELFEEPHLLLSVFGFGFFLKTRHQQTQGNQKGDQNHFRFAEHYSNLLLNFPMIIYYNKNFGGAGKILEKLL